MIQALLLAAPLLLLAEPALQPEPPVPDQIAFTEADERMTVPVTISRLGGDASAAGPFRFIVDTGAERTVISRELAGSLGLAAGPVVRIATMSGSGNVGTFVIPGLRVGAATQPSVPRIEAPALVRHNLGAAGLVGIDTLQGQALTIDFDRAAMTIAPSTKRLRAEHFGPDDIVIHARNLLGQLVVTDASYRGSRIRVVLDTGSVVSIGNLALRRLAARDAAHMTPITLTSVTGAVVNADSTQISEVHFAQTGFANLPVAFSDAPPFKRLGLVRRPALLLGMDALRLFGRVRIDFANRELRLERPRSAFAPIVHQAATVDF